MAETDDENNIDLEIAIEIIANWQGRPTYDN